jgi:DNA-binding IclR family transcriptional regulator
MRAVPAAHLTWPLVDHDNPRDIAVWTMAQESGPREWTVEEVAGALPIPDPSLADTLEALVAAGQIRRVADNRYRLQATAEELTTASSR